MKVFISLKHHKRVKRVSAKPNKCQKHFLLELIKKKKITLLKTNHTNNNCFYLKFYDILIENE